MFEIHFTNHHRWDFRHAGSTLMRVAYGSPALPQANLDRSEFESLLKRIFGTLRSEQVDSLWELTNATCGQRRGALLVVSADARSEAKRLAGQSIAISPRSLSPELLELGTSIDGVLIFDSAGACHAFGVILDGLATDKGSPGRGSRYNSAVRYVESTDAPTVAVSRAELAAKLVSLREVAANGGEPFRRFTKLMEWFNAKRFYLSAEELTQSFSVALRLRRPSKHVVRESSVSY